MREEEIRKEIMVIVGGALRNAQLSELELYPLMIDNLLKYIQALVERETAKAFGNGRSLGSAEMYDEWFERKND